MAERIHRVGESLEGAARADPSVFVSLRLRSRHRGLRPSGAIQSGDLGRRTCRRQAGSKGFASWVTEKDVRPAGMVPGVARRGVVLGGCFASMFSLLRMAGGLLRLGGHPQPSSPLASPCQARPCLWLRRAKPGLAFGFAVPSPALPLAWPCQARPCLWLGRAKPVFACGFAVPRAARARRTCLPVRRIPCGTGRFAACLPVGRVKPALCVVVRFSSHPRGIGRNWQEKVA
jgi:hypothetical protein